MEQNSLLPWVEEMLAEGSGLCGVSAHETGLSGFLAKIWGPYCAEDRTDVTGNRFFLKPGKNGKDKILLAAHADEIGLLVTAVDKNGFIRFAPVGGVDERALLAQVVTVRGRSDMAGVICHAPSKRRAGKPVPLRELAVDVGFGREDVLARTRPGDVISFSREFRMLLNHTGTGKALDDRAGLVTLAVCLRELSGRGHEHDVVAVATAQEEVGCRGAETAAFQVQPAAAVAVDVTHAQSPDAKQIAVQLGKGPVIARGPNLHPLLTGYMENRARDERIPFQTEVSPRPTGTDARALQLAGPGTPTALVSVPLRYMHTLVETISAPDVLLAGKLLAAAVAGLSPELRELEFMY
ncbi:MAG: M20/M25/M40 family metallo-hydrolase [Gracilibacteraceae bacterium]|jgi:endoglucanase|nr:M20/M25/M40 family metallo-hydrolase [Gracilibacteraceae bacterium]